VTTDVLIDGILAREAGYVDDPDDRGGPTNHGITARTLGEWRRLGRPATRAEVLALEVPEARAIYRARYVRPFETVPFGELQAQLVDIGVTSGPATAIVMLQTVLGVPADGILGERTRAALAALPWKLTNNALIGLRVRSMAADVRAHPNQLENLHGWVNRAVLFWV
jgi:lysozyme family protein